MNELDTLVQQAQALFAQCASAADLENAKAQFLGKSGRISDMMKGLSQLDLEAKKSQGAVINAAKQSIEHALNARRQALSDEEYPRLSKNALERAKKFSVETIVPHYEEVYRMLLEKK